MKLTYLITLCAFIFPCVGQAEYNLDEDTLDYVLSTPRYAKTNITSLTYYLIKPYKNDYDKARAIAYYIASTVAYDEYIYNDEGRTKLRVRPQKAKDLLKSKVGICKDFAVLFEAMCQKAGIEANVIYGYAFNVDTETGRKIRNQRDLSQSGHAWNSFKYLGKKIIVDVTFMGQGRTGHEKRITEMQHKRVLNKLKRQDNMYDLTPFYFDFSYAEEKKLYGIEHVERGQNRR